MVLNWRPKAQRHWLQQLQSQRLQGVPWKQCRHPILTATPLHGASRFKKIGGLR